MTVAWSYKRDGVKTLQKGKNSISGWRLWLKNVCAKAPYVALEEQFGVHCIQSNLYQAVTHCLAVSCQSPENYVPKLYVWSLLSGHLK